MNRLLLSLSLTALIAANLSCTVFPPPTPKYDWSWLENTYWYVPTDGLVAIETSLADQSHNPVTDQTVWHITNYSDGYFWGDQVVKLSSSDDFLCMQLVGSITPEGDIQMTFTFDLPQNAPPILNSEVTGLGTMRRDTGQWKAEMQMTTGITTLVTHWAYMTQCREGQDCNQQLPGVPIPLQDFLNKCPCNTDPFCQ